MIPLPLMTLLAAGVVAVVLAALAIITRRPNHRAILAAGVGVTAGLQAIQISQIHLYVFMVAAFILFGGPHRPRIRPAAIVLLAGGCLLASTVLYGPLVNSQKTGLSLLLFVITAAALAVVGEDRDIRPAVMGLLAMTTVASSLAVLQYIGALPLPIFIHARRPTGFLYTEPDYLGLYSAVGALVAIRSGLPTKRRLAFVGVNTVALILTSARAGWLALALGVVLTLLAPLIKSRATTGRDHKSRRTIAAMVAVAAIILIIDAPLRGFTVSRIDSALNPGVPANGNVVGYTDYSAQARINQFSGLQYLSKTAPWYGQGLTASGRVGTYGDLITDGTAPNNLGTDWLLDWWVEGKYVALPLIGSLLLAAFRRWRTLTGALLCMTLLNNLFSNATFQPITWFLVGLCLLPTGSYSGSTPLRRSMSASRRSNVG